METMERKCQNFDGKSCKAKNMPQTVFFHPFERSLLTAELNRETRICFLHIAVLGGTFGAKQKRTERLLFNFSLVFFLVCTKLPILTPVFFVTIDRFLFCYGH
jgi:hypothetical protein